MKHGVFTVYDDYIVTSTTAFTDTTGLDHVETLAEANPLGLQADVELHAAGSGTSLTVVMEHSANGKDWQQKNTYAEIPAPVTSWSVPGRYTLSGGETLPTRPSHGLVRLRLTLDGNGASCEGRVVLRALTRVRIRKAREAFKHAGLPTSVRRHMSAGAAAEVDRLRMQGPHPDTVAEMRQLLSEPRSGSRADALDHAAFYLSARARRELNAFRDAADRLSLRARVELMEAVHRELLGEALGAPGAGRHRR